MHTKHTRNRCEVKSTGEHLLPLPFFLKAKLLYGYFKMKFGIGPRDKQKLNLDGETETCVGMGVLPMTSDWIDTSHGHC